MEHGVGRGGDPHNPGGGSVASCSRDHDISALAVDAQHRALGMERRPGGDVGALRDEIKRLLRKYRYPPDQQSEAIVNVMHQMESLAPRYAEELQGASA